MVESFKYKSKIATAVAFIAMIITALGKDGLTQIIPAEYVWTIPVLIGAASWILAQKTEDHRVEVAEEIVHEQYNDVDPTTETEIETNTENDVVGDDLDGGC
ncbi:MAG: hypothetical protein IJL02_03830 [Methanobrevibacter sp.]|uniref:hypothetical protein n=1 Tax=Methanobrevibacter sp. TaxID=66852 RepID=UPI0025F1FB37|nr:hypothetical protein [Methanobrevibacter sp.]MBQ6098974.1 hypothetical protein [Methanobrevibacter sp.]